MREALVPFSEEGIEASAFGDIFLEDVRESREKNLAKIGMKGIFPLWGKDTKALARSFISLGFKAILTCVDSEVLGREFVGREFDDQLLSDLPEGVDPCGENGEFHTYVYDGPIMKDGIPVKRGGVVFREERFYYCDLLLD